jgi:hypothetical protein
VHLLYQMHTFMFLNFEQPHSISLSHIYNTVCKTTLTFSIWCNHIAVLYLLFVSTSCAYDATRAMLNPSELWNNQSESSASFGAPRAALIGVFPVIEQANSGNRGLFMRDKQARAPAPSAITGLRCSVLCVCVSVPCSPTK